MEKYRELFEFENYCADEPVNFYIDLHGVEVSEHHTIPDLIFARMVCIASAYQLHYIPMISPYDCMEFSKTQVRTMLDELRFVIAVVNDDLLRHYVEPLINLCEKIGHSSQGYSLKTIGF